MVLKGLFLSLPTIKTIEPNLLISVVFLVAWRLWGGPWGDRWAMRHPKMVTGLDESETLNIWWYLGGCFETTHKKRLEPNLVISVLFLVALGLWGGTKWWQMGDALPQEGHGLGRFRGTSHLMVFGRLLSFLLTWEGWGSFSVFPLWRPIVGQVLDTISGFRLQGNFLIGCLKC